METIQLEQAGANFALKNGQNPHWLDVQAHRDIPQEICSCNCWIRWLYKVMTLGGAL